LSECARDAVVGEYEDLANVKTQYIQRINNLGRCQILLTGDYATHGYQVRIRSPYRNITIIAIAIVLLPHSDVGSMNE
jgi:hypothetical protein